MLESSKPVLLDAGNVEPKAFNGEAIRGSQEMVKPSRVVKCLAYIWHAEDYIDKDEALCYVKFITGPFAHRVLQYKLGTDIFKYYYWGVALEEVDLAPNGNILDVRDLKLDTFKEFDIGLIYALSFNEETHDVLGSNGFVYGLDQSMFYNNCRSVCEYIYSEIKTASNFSLRMYTKGGAVLSLLFAKNMDSKHPGYKYAMNRGFITCDKRILRSMIPATETSQSKDSGDKMTQAEIDKLITSLNV